jgi:3-hydroxypropanoate dehydrogenase
MTASATDQHSDLLNLDRAAQDLLFREARTANAFTDEPVTDEQMRAVYDLVKWAPTSMNMQPLRLLLVRSKAARERLLPHLMEGNRAKTASAPLVAVLAADVDFHDNLDRVFPHKPGARDTWAKSVESRRKHAHLNATLQVAYFILGVRAAGLAAGPMTGFDAEGVRGEFFTDSSLEPLVVVNIGHIDHSGTFPRSPRLDYDEVVREI